MINITTRIAEELSVRPQQVDAVLKLFEDGATVPFIARYRKEATGGLDDTQLRHLAERHEYLNKVLERQATILKSIEEQGKLTNELKEAITITDNLARLEDLYLPYKPKRRTKAQIAKEAGLEPLALQLWENPQLDPLQIATQFINPDKEIHDEKLALEGAKQILMEKFAEEAELIGQLREYIWDKAQLASQVVEGKQESGSKFADYFSYSEAVKKIPSHRALALFRGRHSGILRLNLKFIDPAEEEFCKTSIASRFQIVAKGRPADTWLQEIVSSTWQVKLLPKLEVEALMRLRESAETEAIKVFANNVKNLLMAAPAGSQVTMGLDPGLRTGVKVAIIDGTGKLLTHTTVFPHPPQQQWDKSLQVLIELCQQYQVKLISIGNGTASRETDKLAAEIIKSCPELGLIKIVVSEAGASVYSASELAANEFPDLDVSFRGAVSIARRLQDPLAELVKIDPKSIGVGQYQHDVNQNKLAKSLDAVVEDCVNAVGVDVNTASVALLARVSGLNETLAQNIVQFRNENGYLANRQLLRQIPRFGEKTFEQAAGFLRIANGDNLLDMSAVHPEAYPLVEQILEKTAQPIKNIIGNSAFLKTLKAENFVTEQFGIPTIVDILNELEKPGRDPRPVFKAAVFKDGIDNLQDLKTGMLLEGVITNVTNFGAFVDIGVHQDGLVHKSVLANHYVADPHQVVKVGDIVKVKVLEVDLARNRINLSMRIGENSFHLSKHRKDQPEKRKKPHESLRKSPAQPSAFASALFEALKDK